MTTDTSDPSEETIAAAPSRDELLAMVAKAHHGSTYAESTAAGKALAAQSKLPRVVAENLGANFGQWSFFPEIVDIVDFALRYVPPSTPEEVWTIARTWAADDAAGRQTMMALVGQDILQHELRRIAVPELRALVEETRAAKALELRAGLGLDVPAAKAPKKAAARATAPKGAAPKTTQPIPTKMPKPAFVPPPKAAPAAAAKRFSHPKFGEGVLEREDGSGDEAKLTVKFASGSKTLLRRFLVEVS